MDRPVAPLAVGSIDLGSNSFHMIIARVEDQHLRTVDRLREPVCLAAGLDERNCLSDEAIERAVDCLERFAQRLKVPGMRVRAVGTNTLRRAVNSPEVRRRFEQALGHPVEIISGQEEARLIYLGVAHNDFAVERRLVLDIGGGSTEVILGEGFEALRAHSLFMGCVTVTRRFFPDGSLTRERFREAEIAAQVELRSIQQPLRTMGWTSCVGASGTINAVQEILQIQGWSERVTLAGIKKLRKAMVRSGSIKALDLEGLRASRARVLPGGLAILTALFKSLEIESLSAASGALREGLLHDLVGRIRLEDIRDRTVRRLVEQYHVDERQGARVERTVMHLLKHTGATDFQGIDAPKALTWAARLHELGLSVSHTGFHKHGAYLVANSDLAGFSADDQALLAALIRTHRRKISRSLFAHLPDRSDGALRLAVLLRLAALLNRSRGESRLPEIEVADHWSEVRLAFPAGWGETHPLTLADLSQEADFLSAMNVRLKLVEKPGLPTDEESDAGTATGA